METCGVSCSCYRYPFNRLRRYLLFVQLAPGARLLIRVPVNTWRRLLEPIRNWVMTGTVRKPRISWIKPGRGRFRSAEINHPWYRVPWCQKNSTSARGCFPFYPMIPRWSGNTILFNVPVISTAMVIFWIWAEMHRVFY